MQLIRNSKLNLCFFWQSKNSFYCQGLVIFIQVFSFLYREVEKSRWRKDLAHVSLRENSACIKLESSLRRVTLVKPKTISSTYTWTIKMLVVNFFLNSVVSTCPF